MWVHFWVISFFLLLSSRLYSLFAWPNPAVSITHMALSGVLLSSGQCWPSEREEKLETNGVFSLPPSLFILLLLSSPKLNRCIRLSHFFGRGYSLLSGDCPAPLSLKKKALCKKCDKGVDTGHSEHSKKWS